MKKKINKIMGVGLSLMLLASLWVMAIPATAGTLSLGEESSVKDLKAMVDNIIGPAGVDIVDIAVNGNVIYAATGTTTTDNITYKSTDGGATWTSLTTTTNYPASAVTRVAVAPDDPDVVIIATAEPQVYLSNNGGGEWDNLAIPAVTTPVVTINSIDISAGATRYVAIGGATTGSVAELWTLKLAMAQNWQARMAGSGNFTASQTAVMAAKFSPNSVTDETIAVISADAGTTTFQLFRFTEGQTSWNQGIAREGMSSYGTGIALDTGIVGGVAAADIELVSDYLATDLTRRIAFVTSAGATSGGKVYRMTDAARVGAFNEWDDATDVTAIGSLSLNAANSVLLGGRYLSNVVFSWSNPTSGGSPNALRTNTLKLPSGGLTDAKTLVGWNGDTAIAATSGDESAFSVSTDNGYSWNDISLIDTTLTTLNDVAVNADASKIYLTSADATNDTSVWLKTSAGWKRVLSMQGMTATTSPFLVRLAPENDSVVYIASKMTTNMWLSVNGGLETWRHVPAYQLTAIQDFVVESADVVHAIDTSGATKTTNAGATWSTKKNLDGLAGHSITLAPNNDVLVGGSDGYVAFSKDGGATFTRITSKVDTGNSHVVADMDYADNNIIYAGTGDSVKRGKADKSATWSSRTPSFATNHVVTGIANHEGVIYVLTANTTDSRLYRALNLKDSASSALALWSFKESAGEKLDFQPQALKKSDAPKFWTVDRAANTLFSMTDPIALVGPTLTAPADKTSVQVNPDAQAFNVTFIWERPVSQVNSMQIQVAADSGFAAIVYDETFTGIDSSTVAKVIGPTGPTNQVAQFNPGSTYYWRVRVAETGPMYSAWSATRSFAIEAATADFQVTTPSVGATAVSIMPTFVWTPFNEATSYEIAVAEDSTFAVLDWSHNVTGTFYQTTESDTLKYGTTYYWRVRSEKNPWTTGIFTTEQRPVEPTPPIVIEPTPPASPPQIVKVEVPVPGPAQPIPSYLLWTIIAIGAILIIALIVLIVRTRRIA